MNINGNNYRTIWVDEHDPGIVRIIDQRQLPFRFEVEAITSSDAAAAAIADMHVRGAGLIGAMAAYGMYLGAREALHNGRSYAYIREVGEKLISTRPTAVNLSWAVSRVLSNISHLEDASDRVRAVRRTADEIADEDADNSLKIGRFGAELIAKVSARKGGGRVNVLTHCNAGWLAFIDHGTATAPVYVAHDAGTDVHVWVDETRPRNQGARLTAWELAKHGVPHTVIPDNTGGHLMQHGLVDLVIVGTDRTTKRGDVANKIGTYLKALAAADNGVPFYVALPSSSIDWTLDNGVKEIPIEERDGREVSHISGWNGDHEVDVRIVPEGSAVANYGFDVTPSRLITGLITERGICAASEKGILSLFPEFDSGKPDQFLNEA
jgi:methylthioribose-1-phosphate isomerase